jgi:hypothetical protein
VGYWVTHNPRRDLFPYLPRCCQPTVPRFLRIGFILSCPLSSSKFLRHSFRLLLSEEPVLLGFLPYSRHYRVRPLARENALSRYVPSSGFCNLSTAFSASGRVGLLHPTATSRVLSVQGFLSTRSRPDSSPGLFPLAVVEPTTHRPRSAATIG